MLRAKGVRWRIALVASLLGALACAALRGRERAQARELDAAMHHLGDEETKEWTEAPAQPEPAPLEIRFDSRANEREWLLEITARSVANEWALELGGREFARRGDTSCRAPARRPGRRREQRCSPCRRRAERRCHGGPRAPLQRSLREVLQLGRIDVRVTERSSGRPIPARVTVTRGDGTPLDLYYAERPESAVRSGIAYTSDGVAALEVPEGRCQVWASRGMEWSADHGEVDVHAAERGGIELALEREVDTTGWVAADTHVHTLTFSGHGDASVEERMVTLAGEGIELAVATDHNHQTDYRPYQAKLALSPYFTPVVGNEVTTDNGHMNAFPLDPAGEVPPYEETDWKKLVAGIRAKGARVVILNHPRWPDEGKDPLTKFGFDEDRPQLRRPGVHLRLHRARELRLADLSATRRAARLVPLLGALFFTSVGASVRTPA
jgi:hypothetical protein